MTKLLKRIAVLLVITLLAPAILPFIPVMKGMTSTEVYAASVKSSLYTTKATIGIASTPEYLGIKNRNDKATYTYSSKDKKIATVNKYGMITGVKKGTTSITVSEKYKGKVKKVGTITVKVVGASLNSKEISVGISSEGYVIIDYRNNKAKYTFESSDSTTVKVDESGSLFGAKLGNADINVSEVYKGKTTKLGTINVTVKEIPITNFVFYSDNLTIKDNLPTVEYTVGEDASIRYFFEKEPYGATTPVTYVSDNTAVATVSDIGRITTLSEGTAKITVTCGTYTYQIQVIVTKNDSYYDQDYSFEDVDY